MSISSERTTAPPVARIILVRHGSTEWSRTGRHTSRTDLPLDEPGREAAEALASRLANLDIRLAYSSPLRRALETCELAGYPSPVRLEELVEWDYGAYEGRTTAEIQVERPGWSIFVDGCPGGEEATDVARRAERALAAVPLDPEGEGSAVIFAHAHLLRVLGVTYLGLPPREARLLVLDTASVSILGFERLRRVLRVWNS